MKLPQRRWHKIPPEIVEEVRRMVREGKGLTAVVYKFQLSPSAAWKLIKRIKKEEANNGSGSNTRNETVVGK